MCKMKERTRNRPNDRPCHDLRPLQVPETHIKCSGRHTGADNICIIVHAPLVTMSRLSIIHDTGLPTQREIGVRIMPSAHSPVLQKTQLRRAAVLEVNPANGSRALEVLPLNLLPPPCSPSL